MDITTDKKCNLTNRQYCFMLAILGFLSYPALCGDESIVASKVLQIAKDESNFRWCKEPLDFDFNRSTAIKSLEAGALYLADHKYLEVIRFPSGKYKSIAEVDSNEVWNGAMYSWYASGEFLGCAELRDGEHHGKSVAFHPSGNRRAFATFQNGLQEGYEIQFLSNGRLMSATKFIKGQRDGWSFYWAEDAVSYSASLYHNGLRVPDGNK
jgi:hypothetical protein